MKRLILILAIGLAGCSLSFAQPKATQETPLQAQGGDFLSRLNKIQTDDLTLDAAQLNNVAPELVRATTRQKAFRPGMPKGITMMETVYDIDYQKLTVMMMKAMQEQQAIITRQQTELERMRQAMRSPQQ